MRPPVAPPRRARQPVRGAVLGTWSGPLLGVDRNVCRPAVHAHLAVTPEDRMCSQRKPEALPGKGLPVDTPDDYASEPTASRHPPPSAGAGVHSGPTVRAA